LILDPHSLFSPFFVPVCGQRIIALAFDISVDNTVLVEVAQRLENLASDDGDALFVDPCQSLQLRTSGV
jgi:hypothetical protein